MSFSPLQLKLRPSQQIQTHYIPAENKKQQGKASNAEF